MIPKAARGTTYGGLMHAVDYPATVLALAGVDLSSISGKGKYGAPPLDGIDHWDAIMGTTAAAHAPPLREHLPLNVVNNGSDYSAIRFGDMKLILGALRWPSTTMLVHGGQVGSGSRWRSSLRTRGACRTCST